MVSKMRSTTINDIIGELAGVEILSDVPALNAYIPATLDAAAVVIDSSDWSSVIVDVTNTPDGFLGGKNLRVNLRVTQLDPPQYVFVNYSPADPDERYVKAAGDVMTGALTLPSEAPTQDYHASTKKYVDDSINNIPADVNTTYNFAAASDSTNVNLTLSGNDGSEDTVKLTAGSNITFTDVSSTGLTINAGAAGVTKIVAGNNVTISPTSGVGEVTINASGGSGPVVTPTLQEVTAQGNTTTNDIAIGSSTRSFAKFKDLIEYISADLIRDHAEAIAAMDLDADFSVDAITDQPFRQAVEGIVRITSGNINLNADGSAEFHDSVTFGEYSSNTEGAKLFKNGANTGLYINGTGANARAFAVYNGSDSSYPASIGHDGSATFAGSITAAGDIIGSSLVGTQVSSDTYGLFINNTSNSTTSFYVEGDGKVGIGYNAVLGEPGNIILNSDGSATFAGTTSYTGQSGNVFIDVAGTAARQFGFKFDQIGWLISKLSIVEYNSSGIETERLAIEGGDLSMDGSATFAGQVNVNNSFVATGSISSNETIYTKKWFQADRTGSGETIFFGRLNSTPTVTITAGGSATFAGDVAIGDSATFFGTIGDAVALLPNSIVDQFKTVIDGLPKAQPYGATTLPADLPTPLKDALVRATAAGKINLNSDGSASFASTVSVGNDPFPGTATGSALYQDGSIALSSANSTGTIFFGYTTGNSIPTTLIKGDGSASFTGVITAAGYSFEKLDELT